MGIWTLWHPDYGFEALVKAVTAMASVATAVALWRLIPLAVALPSPAQLRRVNMELEHRIAERDLAIADFQREKAERERTEEALLQSQKMDALGQLTGGIAHDFNNLLQALQGSLEIISRRAGDPVKVRQIAQGALGASERGAQLTSKLLAFARTKQLKLEPFLVADMAVDMREILSRSTGLTRDLRFELDAGDTPVLTDRTQLELALLNMVINASDATLAGGQVIVQTEPYRATASDVDLKPGDYIKLSVIDNGSGMPPETVRRAFEPFFTTKDVGKGTGLGLSQVYGVARQANGAARIRSELGRGTTVSIFIPQAPGADAVARPPANVFELTRLPHARVLLVDDETLVRDVACETLESLGLEVVQAGDGRAALETAERLTPDVAVLDYAMPGMNGAELARRLRSRWPGLSIVFVTGYADGEEIERALGPNESILRKPYHSHELAQAMARALGAQATG